VARSQLPASAGVRIARSVAAIAGLVLAVAMAAPASAQDKVKHPGVSIYKSSGCLACHKWHGMGGPGYGGTPINFRESQLTKEQMIEVIACGRPGTTMPFHAKDAYDSLSCYGDMKQEDLGEDMPGKAQRLLSLRQIESLADFIATNYQGRDNQLDLGDCRLFFGTSKMCTNMEAAAAAGGGGGGGGSH